jgi:CRISPR-associated protein Cas1
LEKLAENNERLITNGQMDGPDRQTPKSNRPPEPEETNEIQNPKSKIQNRLLGLEGRAARKYWRGVKQAVRVGPDWPGRRGRGATDRTNSALNYGYGLLYGQIERAIVLAGLDPYAGFIHADRPGKPSLVLDLIEEFRQPVVDRTVFAMLNRRSAIELDKQGLLTAQSRQALIAKLFERLDKPEKYGSKKIPLRIIIQSQARQIATFVRAEREQYQGFAVKW